ncbi:hypothetical protein H072_1057 [Dactylellina haptotyla CBS 200.50]|uniref:Protein kinase domain-containing protein n=1 Tax=Dactylellina haptotyla (strain CBS 200.50) TaxID=1284197 RepID=S8APV9_DACHA|nr:hypothetical protein H072_1057 [Dactylellina haptotyla CBS 200.50]
MISPENTTADNGEQPQQEIAIEADNQLRRARALAISRIYHSGHHAKSASDIVEIPAARPKLKSRSSMPETRLPGHEIEKSGLPSNLFDFNHLDANKVFVRDEAREIMHIFHVDPCPEARGGDPDRGVYYTTFTGRLAVLKFFGDGLGWKGLSMWQQECEARERLKRTGVLPEIFLSGEVILGKFGNRTCRGFAIVMERVEGQVLSNSEMSPKERRELEVALLKIMTVIREHNMVHGEPRRRNVMWDRERQRAVLLDWKEWWENDYGLKPHQREIEIIMASDKITRQAFTRHSYGSI